MQIFVKTLTGQTKVYTISQGDLVSDLIEMINNREQVVSEQQFLAF